ncbi:hypothetical protein [Haloglomus litoreum]|uniref:hypothetical protein n=1 Tax=Haloglomus litoreum TaxID=3034026 RepID=UPI0023E7C0F8|nr:hypothetical protein [Haloglomus sp. DT116]
MQWTRRTLLGGIAAASVPLAGCSLPSDSDPDGASDGGDGGSGSFDQVRVDGRTLVVELGSGTAERVNVIAPDGSAYASTSVAQGATRVEFDIGLSYPPGEYRVVASAGDSTVAETALTIAPDLAITEVGVGANHPERMPENLNYSDEQAVVEITNRGSGPGIVEQVILLGEVPNPTRELAQEGNDTSGIYDMEDGFGDLEQLVIPARDSKVVFTTSKPFLFTADGIECKSRTQRGEFNLEAITRVDDSSLSEQYSIRYSASEEPDQCDITILGGDD